MSVTLKMAEEAKAEKKRPERRRREKPEEKPTFLGEPAKGAPPEPVASPLGKGHRILVVDDNPVVLKAFELKLKAHGFDVLTSATGALVASTAEQAKTELIILDINFPPEGTMEWTGFSIMQWMRRFPELACIPVIFITATERGVHRQKAIEAGAIELFEKPVDFKQLLPAMLHALGEDAQVPEADDAAANEAEPDPTSAGATQPSEATGGSEGAEI